MVLHRHAVSLRPPPAYRRRQAHDRLHPGLAMHRLRQDRGAAAVHRGMPGPQDPDGRQGRPRTRARCRARASGSLPAARCRLAPASCWPRWRRSPSSRPATEGIPFPAPVGRTWWERLQSRCSSAQLKSIATEVAPTGYAPTNRVIRDVPEGRDQCGAPATIAQVSARQQPEFHLDSLLRRAAGQGCEPWACGCGNTSRGPGLRLRIA